MEESEGRKGIGAGTRQGTEYHSSFSAGGARSHKAHTNPCPHMALPPGSPGPRGDAPGGSRRGWKRDRQRPEPHAGHSFGFSEICLAFLPPFIPERTKSSGPECLPQPFTPQGVAFALPPPSPPSGVHRSHCTATVRTGQGRPCSSLEGSEDLVKETNGHWDGAHHIANPSKVCPPP